MIGNNGRQQNENELRELASAYRNLVRKDEAKYTLQINYKNTTFGDISEHDCLDDLKAAYEEEVARAVEQGREDIRRIGAYAQEPNERGWNVCVWKAQALAADLQALREQREAQAEPEQVAVFVEREDGQQARVMVPDVGEDVWTCILEAYPKAYDLIDEGRILVDDGAGYGFDETFRPGEDAGLAAWLKEGLGFAVQVSDAHRPEEAHGADVWCEGRFKDLAEAVAKARQEARSKPANPGRFRKAWVEDADGECVWSSDDEAEGCQ